MKEDYGILDGGEDMDDIFGVPDGERHHHHHHGENSENKEKEISNFRKASP